MHATSQRRRPPAQSWPYPTLGTRARASWRSATSSLRRWPADYRLLLHNLQVAHTSVYTRPYARRCPGDGAGATILLVRDQIGPGSGACQKAPPQTQTCLRTASTIMRKGPLSAAAAYRSRHTCGVEAVPSPNFSSCTKFPALASTVSRPRLGAWPAVA